VTPLETYSAPDDWARSQVGVRALVVLGSVASLLAAGPAGHPPPWWLVAAVAALAGASAWVPDSPFGVAPLLVVLGWWAAGLGDSTSPWVLAGAAGLVVAHVAGLLASYGPATMQVDGAAARMWARRGALVLLTAPVAWVVTRLLGDEPEQPGVWVLGIVAACVAAVVATAALIGEEER